MCRVPVQLRELVKQRLAAAAEEIFELLEKTITEYEEHLVCKYEQQRRQEALCTPDTGFPVKAAEGLSELPLIKEEQDGVETQLCSKTLSAPTWNTHSPLQTQPAAVSGVIPETEETSGVSVKTEEVEENWTPPPQHTTVPPPPAGGALLQHIQTVPLPPAGGALPQTEEERLLQDTWRETQMDFNRSLDCAFPLPPPGGALLHQDTVGKMRKRRSGSSSSASQKRPHECPLCGLRFQSHFNLETHLRVHTGERPFSCPVCEKTFNRKDSMANHMKIHLGETFCCSECGKRYSDKSNLRRHALSMHAGKGHLSRPGADSHDLQRRDVT